MIRPIFSYGAVAAALSACCGLGAAEMPQITAPDSAVAAEITAAAELNRFMTPACRHGIARVQLGQTPEIAAALRIDFGKLSPDEIIIARKGDTLFISGSRPRGTYYAALEFLERFAGVRFYAPDCTVAPPDGGSEVPDGFFYRYAPPFVSREAYYKSTLSNPEFAARMRLNGHFTRLPEKFGGNIGFSGGDAGFCHTFKQLVPKEKYFKNHPEFFSLINGKRNPAQLCLTNAELQSEITRNVLDMLERDPAARIVSLSQNDGWGRCQCRSCEDANAFYSSPSGTLLAFLNPIADAVAVRHPGVMLETIAYVYSQKPPQRIVPRGNLMIRLCSIQGDFARPLDSDANADFRNDFIKWRNLTSNLAIWNYVTDFSNYLLIHPNIENIATDLRYFAANNAVWVFEQGDAFTGNLGDYNSLRTYLISKLLWNPGNDENALISEFMSAYYGPSAGPLLEKTIRRCHELARMSKEKFGCYREDSDWISFDELKKLRTEQARALAMVAGDPILSRRAGEAMHSSAMMMMLHKDACTNPEDAGMLRKLYDGLVKTFAEYGVDRCCEWVLFADTCIKIEQNIGMRPRPVIAKNEAEIVALQSNPRAKKVAQWDSRDIAAGGEFDITGQLPPSGKFELRFVYTSGPHASFVRGVRVFRDGDEAAADLHYGVAGFICRDYIYHFDLGNNRARQYVVKVNFNPMNDDGEICSSGGEIWLIGE